MGDTLRSFLALELSDSMRRAATAVSAELAARPRGDGVRWVEPEGMHVTLRFLGDIAADGVESLAAGVRNAVASARPFDLQLAGLTAFPSPRRPRVIVLELEPVDELGALAATVNRGVVDSGVWVKSESPARFRGHVTLGRVKTHGPTLDPTPKIDPALARVEEVVLFRSELRPKGARYTPLERLRLGGS